MARRASTITRWIALMEFTVKIICSAKPGRSGIPHRYSKRHSRTRQEIYGGIVQSDTGLTRWVGRPRIWETRRKKFGVGKKARITLSLISNNSRVVATCKRQPGVLKERLLEYEAVRRMAKRLRVPMHNMRAYSIEYANRLKPGLRKIMGERMGGSDWLAALPWQDGPIRGVVGRIKTGLPVTPIVPPVTSTNRFVEGLVLKDGLRYKTDPHPSWGAAFYISLSAVIGCFSAICMHFFLSSH